MIEVQLNRRKFEYDIHSLVKAFYPEQVVRITYVGAAAEPDEEDGQAAAGSEEEDGQAAEPGKKEGQAVVGPEKKEGQAVVGPEKKEGQAAAGSEKEGGQAVAGPGKKEGQAAKTDEKDGRTAAGPNREEGRSAVRSEKTEDRTAAELIVEVLFSAALPEGDAAESDAAQLQIQVRLLAADGQARDGGTQLAAQTDRREVKNELKRLLYRLLSEFTGQKLPWGNLTGIRPTKIPMALLEQGRKNSEIAQYMRDTYYVSREKTALAVAIANREKHILKDINYQNGYSLYVGIPFCPSICLYCSFSSSPLHLWKDQVDCYLDALCREIDYASDAFAGKELNTVYIGGGTPTTLEPHQMDRLLTKLEQSFCYEHLREFTVEAGRPDSITREKLEVLRAHGISRISINPQTMNQKTLDLIGRRHTVEETEEAFALARSMGFDNINMDLIVGLPGEEKPEVEHTMQEIARLAPDSVTVHSLAVKRAARLRLFKEEHKEMTMTNNREIMDMTAEYAQRAGLFPYYLYRQKNMAGNFENVGYAREGCEGIYNILIMEEVQSILALGAGASTKLVWAKDRIERIENVKDIRNYIDRIDEMIERKRSGLYERSKP